MEEKKYYCYICGKEITAENRTDEHIILNAIGGHLRSYTIICRDCNTRMGETADAKLAEDLSFFTDMLKVRKNRQNRHNQVMTDDEGHEIIVDDGGRSLKLRRPYSVLDTKDGVTNVHIAARNEKELQGILSGYVQRGELTQAHMDEIMGKAKMEDHQPVLSKSNSISTEAFPSIIKSAANFYVDKTHDIARAQHLVPYIEGKADCKDVLYLHHFKTLPYKKERLQVTHMIHIEGSKDTGLLYAMMEYYSIYVYMVVIDNNYAGEDINMTYTWDVVAGQEVERDFRLPMTMKDLEDFRNQPHSQYVSFLPFVQKRADEVMAVWERANDHEDLHDAIEKAFSRFPEGCRLEPEMIAQVEQDVMDYFIKKINRSFKLRKP